MYNCSFVGETIHDATHFGLVPTDIKTTKVIISRLDILLEMLLLISIK